MPLNQAGKHFSRPADAMRSDAPIGMDDAPDSDDDQQGQAVTITKKPDGSFCTEQDGDQVEHPDLASALEALGGAFKEQPEMDDAMSGGGDEEEQY